MTEAANWKNVLLGTLQNRYYDDDIEAYVEGYLIAHPEATLWNLWLDSGDERRIDILEAAKNPGLALYVLEEDSNSSDRVKISALHILENVLTDDPGLIDVLERQIKTADNRDIKRSAILVLGSGGEIKRAKALLAECLDDFDGTDLEYAVLIAIAGQRNEELSQAFAWSVLNNESNWLLIHELAKWVEGGLDVDLPSGDLIRIAREEAKRGIGYEALRILDMVTMELTDEIADLLIELTQMSDEGYNRVPALARAMYQRLTGDVIQPAPRKPKRITTNMSGAPYSNGFWALIIDDPEPEA